MYREICKRDIGRERKGGTRKRKRGTRDLGREREGGTRDIGREKGCTRDIGRERWRVKLLERERCSKERRVLKKERVSIK